MKNFIKKIWNDSVGSKIISAVLIYLFTLGYNLLKSIVSQTSFVEEFKTFWQTKIELWLMVLFLFAIYLIVIVSRKYKKNESFKYEQETLELDRKLFNKIRNELVTNKSVEYFRSNRFSSGRFEDNKLDFIYETMESSRNPDFEFFHPELEIVKKELISSLKKFDESTLNNIFSAKPIGWLAIPKDWDEERYFAAVEVIRKGEDEICKKYDSFIKTGRRILKI